MIETAFVVGVGMITGTVLGVLLARNLLAGDSMGSPVENFTVPWVLILVILVATVVAALSMTWLPSRQAGRIAPAEALRYE
jgi:ABC-type antimicrobial peptide transport system permease subunit